MLIHSVIDFPFRYETEVYTDWTQGVDEVAKANLDKPLIIRDPDTLAISVNFDPKVYDRLAEALDFMDRSYVCLQAPLDSNLLLSNGYHQLENNQIQSYNKA